MSRHSGCMHPEPFDLHQTASEGHGDPTASLPPAETVRPDDGPTYDVAVIGGGTAGLSAAVALSRFRRSVVVIDDGTPRNAPAGHIHNLLSRDGVSPEELYRLGRDEVDGFGGEFVRGTVDAVRGELGAFTLDVADERLTAGRVIVATGGWDELPQLPGLAERWGKDVIHCGFCHGYEVRDQRVGVLATSPMAAHQAMMFRLLSPHVTLLAHTTAPSSEQHEDLARRGIAVASGTVTEVLSESDHLSGVVLEDGTRIELDALVVAPVVHARADFLAPLGLQPTEFAVDGHTMATQIETGPSGSTDVPGVRTAGNASEPMGQVVNAAASGLAAASAMVGEFVLAGASAQ